MYRKSVLVGQILDFKKNPNEGKKKHIPLIVYMQKSSLPLLSVHVYREIVKQN